MGRRSFGDGVFDLSVHLCRSVSNYLVFGYSSLETTLIKVSEYRFLLSYVVFLDGQSPFVRNPFGCLLSLLYLLVSFKIKDFTCWSPFLFLSNWGSVYLCFGGWLPEKKKLESRKIDHVVQTESHSLMFHLIFSFFYVKLLCLVRSLGLSLQP